MPLVREPQVVVGTRLGLQLDDLVVAIEARNERMDMQLAEAPAEGNLLFGRDVLITEKNHQVFKQRLLDFLIDPISSGEYDPELLTDSERTEIESRLRTDL